MFHSLFMLAIEANQVVGLRVMKLMLGGKRARREAELMVKEKVDAALQAGASLMTGASGEEIVERYRQHVKANARRLARGKRRRSRKRRR
jgi:hypothetical protein